MEMYLNKFGSFIDVNDLPTNNLDVECGKSVDLTVGGRTVESQHTASCNGVNG